MAFPTVSLTISELLSGPYLLSVPIYQRPYSWRRDQLEQLFDDLLESAGLGAEDSADPGYFLGTILLMDAPGNVTTKLSPKLPAREFDVVDGQQRIVSLLTLFAVLRDLETDPKKPIGKRVAGMMSAQLGPRFFRTERPRMQLNGADAALFEQSVLLPGSTLRPAVSIQPTPSEVALIGARDLFRALAEDLAAPIRQALFDYVADHSHVVVIVSHDIDRAHRTFVVPNERGKKLQKNDILKADVLSRLPASQVAAAAEKWNAASLSLGDDFEKFFAHLRAAYGYARPQVVSGVRAVIRESGGAESFLNKVFLPLSQAYSLIRSGGEGVLPETMSRRLLYLNRLADGDWAPAAMLALQHWQQDPEYAQFLIEEIDRQAHLSRLLCASTGRRIRRFADLISAIRTGDARQRNHPSFQFTRDEVRNIAFHLRDLHKRDARVCKLLLLRLSDEIEDLPTRVDPDLYTIEHVLPQRPSATSPWRQSFATPQERADVVDSLGNLVLITQSQNDKARNASWEQKKEIYAVASNAAPLLAITRDVLDITEWRRSEIEAREQRLIELIETLWRVDLHQSRPSSRAAE